jgi:hypothetical protein
MIYGIAFNLNLSISDDMGRQGWAVGVIRALSDQ